MSSSSSSSSSSLLTISSMFLLILVPSLGLTLDGTLLLSFKYSILDDPLSVLDNWNYEDPTPCLWTGVTCAQVNSPFGTPDLYRVISLVLPNSKLLGTVPEDLGLIQHLHTLDLSNNFLNGSLPISLFNASELQILSLSGNGFSGWLPELSSSKKSLQLLNLSSNALAGNLPKNLPTLVNLTVVSLRNNYFSGSIPGVFLYVEVLDLSSNLFNGSLPDDFGGEKLRYLNLSSNKFSGLVSQEFAEKIPGNVTIDLSFNNLKGEIPQSMALWNQKTDSFRGNLELCGKPLKKLCTIPSSLSSPPNISTNTTSPAIAAIPKTFGTKTPLPSSSSSSSSGSTTTNAPQDQAQHKLKPGAIVGIVMGDLAGIGVLAIVSLYVYRLKKRGRTQCTTLPHQLKKKNVDSEKASQEISAEQKGNNKDSETTPRSLIGPCSCLTITNGEETPEASGSSSENNINFVENQQQGGGGDHHDDEIEDKYKNERSLVIVDGETELELENLLKASAYILGSSSTSIVYKAVLEGGISFAVRRIGSDCGFERLKDFEHQVKAIAKLRHPNLVRIKGFYWGDDEKLIIYDYVSNGSLANAAFRKMGASSYHMPFEVRLKIARGVARGLAYIHEKKHVHGNVKPSNILLTQEMEPLISDFGLNGLIHGKHSQKPDGSVRHFGNKKCPTTTSGDEANCRARFMGCTSPHHAPESLNNHKPNSKWDVYSFGIVLLELLTGKVFSNGELGQWTGGPVHEDKNLLLRMADMGIRGDVANREEATLECFKLGFSCASLIAQNRPSMKDALQVLEKIPCSSNY